MNEVKDKENVDIENMIYEVRGVQVMFDFDLARIYGCINGTKSITLAVKRNIKNSQVLFIFR